MKSCYQELKEWFCRGEQILKFERIRKWVFVFETNERTEEDVSAWAFMAAPKTFSRAPETDEESEADLRKETGGFETGYSSIHSYSAEKYGSYVIRHLHLAHSSAVSIKLFTEWKKWRCDVKSFSMILNLFDWVHLEMINRRHETRNCFWIHTYSGERMLVFHEGNSLSTGIPKLHYYLSPRMKFTMIRFAVRETSSESSRKQRAVMVNCTWKERQHQERLVTYNWWNAVGLLGHVRYFKSDFLHSLLHLEWLKKFDWGGGISKPPPT